MLEPYKGGCACGRLRYEIAGSPLFSNHCQCRDCQRESGTGHGSHLTFNRENVEVSGNASLWEMTGDSGNAKTRAFCPVCGAPVYMTFSSMPDLFTIRAASLDDPARFQPDAITYASAGHGWDYLDPAVPAFARMPPSAG